jgi:uncharacterized integral membrane protein
MMHDAEASVPRSGPLTLRDEQEEAVRRENDDDQGQSPEPRERGWVERREGVSPKILVAGGIVILLLLFALQNTDRTHLDFLFLDGDFPLWVILAVGAVLGFAAGWFVSGARRRRRLQREAKGRGRG